MNRLIPLISDRGALKDGPKRVGYAGRDNDDADEVDADSEGFVTGREHPEIEQEDRTFGKCYAKAVEDQPCNEALEFSSIV